MLTDGLFVRVLTGVLSAFAVYLPAIFRSSMRYVVLFLFWCSFLSFRALAQTWPKEGDTLHYRIVAFKFPDDKKTKDYAIEIARGTYNSEDSFRQNVLQTLSGKTNTIIGEIPSFGTQYTWRVTGAQHSKTPYRSPFHHFSTGMVPGVDTNATRVHISHHAERFADAYFFMDGSRAMYDMNGHAVWYLTELGGKIRANASARDIKLSPQGTITFLVESDAYEVDYNCNILWMGPDGRRSGSDSLEGYHHELTRLSNGHYIVMGFEPVLIPKDALDGISKKDTAALRAIMKKKKNRYDNILEYDEKGKVVWSWNAGKYYEGKDMSAYHNANIMADHDVHGNSVYFDEQNNFIYVSFRNVSEVLKIKYPSGEVVQEYGKLAAGQEPPNPLFCGQHSCKRSSDGYVYLFNNGCSLSQAPTVVMLKEPQTGHDALEKVWEFKCPVELLDNSKIPMRRKYQFTTGGGVVELSDRSLLVTTCSPYSKVFIVNRDKKILWSCEPERWHNARNAWSPLMHYRTCLVERKDFEKLVRSSVAR